jgi:hypothetical protein
VWNARHDGSNLENGASAAERARVSARVKKATNEERHATSRHHTGPRTGAEKKEGGTKLCLFVTLPPASTTTTT